MATYVNDLRLKEITQGDEDGVWGTSANLNFELAAEGFSYGTEAFASDANETFTMADGSTDPVRSLYLKFTSAVSLTATRTATLAPNTVSKVWIIENATTGSQSITIKQGSGSTVTIGTGKTVVVYTDGGGSGASVVQATLGDVTKVGTPLNNQIGVWTGDGTLEGTAGFTFDSSTDKLAVPASGDFGFGAVNILTDVAGTTTLNNIDALDATTEATLKTALEGLPILLDATTFSTTATHAVTWAAGYEVIKVQFINCIPVSDAVDPVFETSTDAGSTYHTSYKNGVTTTATITSALSVGSDTNEIGLSGELTIYAPDNATYHLIHWKMQYVNSSGSVDQTTDTWMVQHAENIDAYKFTFSSGSIESGKALTFGIRSA